MFLRNTFMRFKVQIPFLREYHSYKKNKKIRPVYFGLRFRLLAMLIMVMVVFLSFVALILYQHQVSIIEQETSANAETLTRILAGPAEIYLDRMIDTSTAEANLKLDLIEKESRNFLAYNENIEKIVIIDDKGVARYSSLHSEIGKNIKSRGYVKKALELAEDKVSTFSFSVDEKSKKSKKVVHTNYLTVITPVYLKAGLMMDILKDYQESYPSYHNAKSSREKRVIYTQLFKKYINVLSEDFTGEKAEKDKKIKQKNDKAKNKQVVKKQKTVDAEPEQATRKNDIDFLFHHLFLQVMHARNKSFHLPREKRFLLHDAWLFKLKNELIQARENQLLARENEITDEIGKNLDLMADSMMHTRRLGSIAILFNTDKIENDRRQILSSVILPWIGPVPGFYFLGIIFILMGLVFFFVLDYMVKNIKRLENWAMGVANGNLGQSIYSESGDEIGRLGDVFNHMLKEIIIKYHLEKFVSSSTKSMITKQSAESSKIETGVTGRRNYSFIFSDVRGFTAFTESNPPEKVMEVLNSYLDLQSNIVKSNKGDIDDYVGDQIMAHFRGENRADVAISSAMLMMRAVKQLNREREEQDLPTFEVGIGVHGGQVVTGNVGSSFRMDFACLGDAVNLTSRLCSAAKAGEILVSEELFKKAKKKYPHEAVDPVHVKGKKGAISIIRLKPDKWKPD